MSEEKGTESKEDEQATEDIQAKLDKAIGEGNTPKKRVRVVETSDVPVFTDKLIKAKGKKTYTVEFVFDDDIYQIEVRRGMPMEFAVLLKLTAEVYALRRKRISEETKTRRTKTRKNWMKSRRKNRGYVRTKIGSSSR